MKNRLLTLAGAIARSNFTRLPGPYKLTMLLTYRCNCRCELCRIWERYPVEHSRKVSGSEAGVAPADESPKMEMSPEELERFFTNYPRFSWINLSGGEIFLRKDLDVILETICTKSESLYLLDFPTNGALPDIIESRVRELLPISPPLLLVTVSLDGPPELHDRMRGVKGSWQSAVETFARLRDLENMNAGWKRGYASGEAAGRLRVFFGTTLSSGNLNFLDEMLDAVSREIKGTGWNDFHLNLAHESAHYYGNLGRVHGDNGSARKLVEELIRRRDRSLSPVMILERIYQGKLLDYLETGTTPVPCQAMRASCFIDPYWNLFPCSIFDLPLGNLRDSGFSLTDIWEAPETQSARKKISDGRCPHCWTPCEAYQSILSGLSRGSFFPG